jgi:ABC-type polysaccharide/polyol phosphate export permease
VQASRDCFYLLKMPSAGSLLWITASSVIVFIVGWVVFQRHASEVTEEL